MPGLLNQVSTIQRKARISDGQGGWTEAYADHATARGRIRPASASERTAGAQRQALITHVAYYPLGTDARRDDRLVFGGLVVTARAVRQPSARHHLEIDAEEVQAGG